LGDRKKSITDMKDLCAYMCIFRLQEHEAVEGRGEKGYLHLGLKKKAKK
jgi:hypothetical protein